MARYAGPFMVRDAGPRFSSFRKRLPSLTEDEQGDGPRTQDWYQLPRRCVFEHAASSG
jgi:hypothetical protein